MIIRRAIPVHYDISLYDLEFSGAFGFQGTVKIDVQLNKPTKEITLNAYQLQVHSAKIQTKDGQCK